MKGKGKIVNRRLDAVALVVILCFAVFPLVSQNSKAIWTPRAEWLQDTYHIGDTMRYEWYVYGLGEVYEFVVKDPNDVVRMRTTHLGEGQGVDNFQYADIVGTWRVEVGYNGGDSTLVVTQEGGASATWERDEYDVGNWGYYEWNVSNPVVSYEFVVKDPNDVVRQQTQHSYGSGLDVYSCFDVLGTWSVEITELPGEGDSTVVNGVTARWLQDTYELHDTISYEWNIAPDQHHPSYTFKIIDPTGIQRSVHFHSYGSGIDELADADLPGTWSVEIFGGPSIGDDTLVSGATAKWLQEYYNVGSIISYEWRAYDPGNPQPQRSYEFIVKDPTDTIRLRKIHGNGLGYDYLEADILGTWRVEITGVPSEGDSTVVTGFEAEAKWDQDTYTLHSNITYEWHVYNPDNGEVPIPDNLVSYEFVVKDPTDAIRLRTRHRLGSGNDTFVDADIPGVWTVEVTNLPYGSDNTLTIVAFARWQQDTYNIYYNDIISYEWSVYDTTTPQEFVIKDPYGTVKSSRWHSYGSGIDSFQGVATLGTWYVEITNPWSMGDTTLVVDNGNVNELATYSLNSGYHDTSQQFSFVHITDLHIGDGYDDYGTSGYNDTPPMGDIGHAAQTLRNTVNWINANNATYNIKFVIITGDITNSAEKSEFMKAKEILDTLKIPYIPLIGNHDIWPSVFTGHIGWWPFVERADSPCGDEYFKNIFAPQFEKLKTFFSKSWDDGTRLTKTWNPEGNCYSYFQNFYFDYAGYHFICTDFNSRKLFNIFLFTPWESTYDADLFNFDDGTWPWFTQHYDSYRYYGADNMLIFAHHPLIWDYIIGGQLYAFGKDEFGTVSSFLNDSAHKYYTGLWCAGHMHRNKVYNITTIGWPFHSTICPGVETGGEADGCIRIFNVWGKTSEKDPKGVILYENAGYSGLAEFFPYPNPDYSLHNSVVGDNETSSLRFVGGMAGVKLWRNANLQGDNRWIMSDVYNLRDDEYEFNDVTSSLSWHWWVLSSVRLETVNIKTSLMSPSH